MSIPFTQYLRPNGRRRDVEIDMSREDQDIAIEVCPNGPEVPKRVEKLVRRSIVRLRELGCSELGICEHLD